MATIATDRRTAVPTEEQYLRHDTSALVSRHDFMAVAALVSRFDVRQHIHATGMHVYVTFRPHDPDAGRLMWELHERYDVDDVTSRDNPSLSVRLSGGWDA